MNAQGPHTAPAHPVVQSILDAWGRPVFRWAARYPYLVAAILVAGYAAVFAPVNAAIGPAVGALSVLICIALGVLLPMPGWLLMWLAISVANVLLYAALTQLGIAVQVGGAAVGLVGCLMGWLARSAWKTLQFQRHELDAAHRQLLHAQAALVQSAKLTALGELAAGVGHELNQPLQVIRLAADAVKRALGPAAQDLVRQHVDTIQSQTQRASAIITQLRTLGRSGDSGRRAIVDVNPIVRGAMLLFANRWREANILAHVDLAENLPGVLCNPAQIEEALVHLYLNATDAVEAVEQRLVTIGSRADADAVCITVRDSGHGIAAAHLPRVFEPFFTTKPVGKGRGLGLAVSYRILAEHGGTLAVESVSGRGATFELRLPVTAPLRAGRQA